MDRHITSTKLSDRLDKYTEEKESLKEVLRENALKDKDIAELRVEQQINANTIKNKQLSELSKLKKDFRRVFNKRYYSPEPWLQTQTHR